eukprot:987660-Prorocentrum_minimum.AAC.1
MSKALALCGGDGCGKDPSKGGGAGSGAGPNTLEGLRRAGQRWVRALRCATRLAAAEVALAHEVLPGVTETGARSDRSWSGRTDGVPEAAAAGAVEPALGELAAAAQVRCSYGYDCGTFYGVKGSAVPTQ